MNYGLAGASDPLMLKHANVHRQCLGKSCCKLRYIANSLLELTLHGLYSLMAITLQSSLWSSEGCISDVSQHSKDYSACII